jgi:hypothetical protein
LWAYLTRLTLGTTDPHLTLGTNRSWVSLATGFTLFAWLTFCSTRTYRASFTGIALDTMHTDWALWTSITFEPLIAGHTLVTLGSQLKWLVRISIKADMPIAVDQPAVQLLHGNVFSCSVALSEIFSQTHISHPF